MYFVPEGQPDSSQARSAWSYEVQVHRYPGTSCLATIGLSLRDKSHSPIEGPRIKLALIGLKPWAEFCCPFGLRGEASSLCSVRILSDAFQGNR
jgi:hypothetical protein